MKNAFIIGAGGHGNVIASIIRKNYSTIQFVDIKASDDVMSEDEYFTNIESHCEEDVFIGIGDIAIRTKIFNKLKAVNITAATCVSLHAFVAHDAVLGDGVVISHGCVIGSKAVIGNNAIINTCSSVDHDCIVGENCHITAGVTITGGAVIGKNCFFGVKSATVPYVKIGDNAVIMAGSLVYKNVPESVMVEGNPARVVKNINA